MTSAFEVRSTAEEAKVKFLLVKELAYFVGRSFQRFGRVASDLRWMAVVNAINSELAYSMVQGAKDRTPEPELRARVIAQFFKEYEANCRMFCGGSVHPMELTRWAEERAHIQQAYGTPLEHVSAPPSVDGALQTAWSNLRLSQQRLAVWLSLGALLFTTSMARDKDSAELQDYDAVSKFLTTEVRTMERRMLMFSLLQGGQAADRAKEWMLKTSFSSHMAVMEYVSPDGELPHSWKSADEQALRDSIAACASVQSKA